MIEENKDKELFDRIAIQYSRKDIYPISREARKFQLISLLELCPGNNFENILELGCGPGYSSIYLHDRYKKYTGLDYSKSFIEIAKELNLPGTKFIEGNIKKLSFLQNENFDLIFGVGILHHVDDINSVLKSINEISNNETIVAFVEPSMGNPFIQVLRFIRKIIDKNYNQDQRNFQKHEIKEIFGNNGFQIEKIKFQGYFSTPFAQVILRPEFLFKPICNLAIRIDRFIQRKFNNPLSWNIVWTAKKHIEK